MKYQEYFVEDQDAPRIGKDYLTNMSTTDYQIEKQQEEMDRVEAKLNIRTLTDFIYHVIKDKDQAHEVDQIVRNKLSPYLMDKPETIRALYGEGNKTVTQNLNSSLHGV